MLTEEDIKQLLEDKVAYIEKDGSLVYNSLDPKTFEINQYVLKMEEMANAPKEEHGKRE